MDKSRSCHRVANHAGVVFTLAVLLLAGLGVDPARAARLSDVPTTSTWVAEGGAVKVIARTSSTLYLGGSFTHMGPATGGFVPIGASNGMAVATIDKVNGFVYACVSDGAGGYYIGGYFKQVGALARNNIAHIMADGHVDPAWNPDASNKVYALAVANGTVYVGGDFLRIGGQSRQMIAALDAVSGTATAWNPKAAGSTITKTIMTLAVSGGTVYVGGKFTSIAGKARKYLAAMDASTGALLTDWNPNPNGGVSNLVVVEGTIYACGSFTSIGGQSRNYVAALDATTGAATAWNPNANSLVTTLAVTSGTVYAGGHFTTMGGRPRNYLAAVDDTSGTVTTWNPSADGDVYVLAVTSGTVYAGGKFKNIGGQARSRLAELDAMSGAATAWNPDAGDSVNVLGLAGGTVYAGGDFASIGGKTRNYLAALDAASGVVTDWNPDPGDRVYALAAADGVIYAGGAFTRIGGQTRNYLAALEPVSGAATAWNPNLDHMPETLVAWGGKIYAGGDFTTVGGQKRNYLAELDPVTGAATAWDPNPNNWISVIAVTSGTIYVGGGFTSIGGKPRNRLAAIELETGKATDWNPNADDDVVSLAVKDGSVYVGGMFSNIGGQARNYLAEVDKVSGMATAWNPNPDERVLTLAVANGKVYAGGTFVYMNKTLRIGLAELDAVTGVATAWDPWACRYHDNYYYSDIRSIIPSQGGLYVGGYFEVIGGQRQPSFAQFVIIPSPLEPNTSGVIDIQPSSLTLGWIDASNDEDGFKVWADPGAGAPTTLRATVTTGTTSWAYSGLTPNTQYAFQVAATNSYGDSYRTNVFTTFTLAAAPTMDENIASTMTVGEVRVVGQSVTFSNPAGFGVGTDGGGAFAVSGYRWAWDENATYAFNGGEAAWGAGELSLTPARAGRYYLHLQSLNATGVATRQTADLGPFNLVTTNGLKNWQNYR